MHKLDLIIQKEGNSQDRLIPILWEIQKDIGCISLDTQTDLSKKLNLSPAEIQEVVSFYHFFSEEYRGKHQIYIDSSIIADFHDRNQIKTTFENELKINTGSVTPCGTFGLFETSCIGMSDQSPAVLIDFIPVPSLTVEKVKIILNSLKNGIKLEEIILSLGLGDGANSSNYIQSNINNNIVKKGHFLFKKWSKGEAISIASQMSPENIIQVISDSGLKGRGGAGFPTGLKWKLAKEVPSDKKYIVCNADEGEPGTFKDRVLLTEFIGLLLEGMIIASKAVGASKGYIYLRGEYSYLKNHIERQILDFKESGFINSFPIEVFLGAGAYICGEESALLESLEGKRGEPRIKPPFPVEQGLFGCPTVVNNVETFVLAAQIIRFGHESFSSLGTESSRGIRLLSISGDVEKPGIYEYEWGVSISEILRDCKAIEPTFVQVGGPSGTMISNKEFDRKISHDDLPTGGSFMVFSKKRSLFDILSNFMDFFVDESCGNCTPCRAGNVILRDLLTKVKTGKARPSDLNKIKDWGNIVSKTSRCGLGMTSPNPLLTSLKSMPEYFENAITNKDENFLDFDIEQATAEYKEFHNE
ncbi:MAG: NAD(P)H-dependent oxidoreductase subunit E [Bacteriovoracaceae bacterium]|nr:NAD(P)H-dependent oxidoreductase subunit E [Bacteriovoracaceae bacterium]